MADHGSSSARPWAVVLLIGLSPLLLVGVGLTLSVYGAIFGLPLLIATVPPTRWAARLVRSEPGRPDRRLGTWTLVLAAGLALGLAGAAVVGLDDLDAPGEITGVAVAGLWIAGLATAAARVGGRLRSGDG